MKHRASFSVAASLGAVVLYPLIAPAILAAIQIDDCEWHLHSTGAHSIIESVKSSKPNVVQVMKSQRAGFGAFKYRCKKSGTSTISYTYLDSGLDSYSDTLVVECTEDCDQARCPSGLRSSATVLLPYFEVDLADADGRTALISVNNGVDQPQLARVTLWTDWGVPTLSFHILLSGLDVQALNLRSLFLGHLPDTSPVLADPELPLTDFPICSPDELAAGGASLSPAELAALQADHTGQPNAAAGNCAGFDHGDSVARGYLTVDAVYTCSGPPTVTAYGTPPFGFFDPGNLAPDNVLWGDYYLLDPAENFAQGDALVSIPADAERFSPGDYTFYGRYGSFNATDARVPLGGLYQTRFLNGGPFDGGTKLLIWRELSNFGFERAACGTTPSWYPLGELQVEVYDEDENGVFLPGGLAELCPTAQLGAAFTCDVNPDLLPPVPFGFLSLDLWHGDDSPAQAWVTPVLSARGRFSVGYSANSLDDMCGVSPIPAVPVGEVPTQTTGAR